MQPIRVVLYGRPVAGKTTILKAFSRTRSMRVRGINVASGCTDFEIPDRVGVVAESVSGIAPCESSTIPGGVFGDAPWRTLLDGAQALVVVFDCLDGTDTLNGVVQKLNSIALLRDAV